ncbi:MAG: DUF433 domain-containing protein [Dokdonella sp.]|uniref:DUF433 domain-containing protein n=1 Tax=Dokdonella sp. TaxID=2291710 RepID=UPI0031C8DD61|nr:DUF433 domain-containing protein [Xanthomonadales bacterium]MBK7211526.1 DUF433 domain-containing protein [Xanthomonadales bacterium]MBL0221308.1 DUF433 domain-containing protein [Xanthomonadales bacterium]
MKHPAAADIRNLPLYSPAEAARFLHLPASTVRAWAFGQGYKSKDGAARRFEPVIETADPDARRLSFVNLVELLVLAAIRKEHEVELKQVRSAIEYLRKKFPSKHPLADNDFQTDGIDLFVEKYGDLLNISHDGQIAMKEIIQQYLKLVERDASGVPFKLHLPRRANAPEPLAAVVIDPKRGFGRPVLDGRGIRTEVVVERFQAGESIASLAEDYGLDPSVIEDILRSQQPLAA